MSHLVVLTVTGVIVVAAVAAVLELVTLALVAAGSGLRLFVRMVRALVRGGRSRRTSGLATAPVLRGAGAVALKPPPSPSPTWRSA